MTLDELEAKYTDIQDTFEGVCTILINVKRAQLQIGREWSMEV